MLKTDEWKFYKKLTSILISECYDRRKCLACIGENVDSCTECIAGYYISDGVCVGENLM